MTRTLSPTDAALLALYVAGASTRPATIGVADAVLAELRRRGLVVRVIGGLILSEVGSAKARALAGQPVMPADDDQPLGDNLAAHPRGGNRR